MMVIGLWPIRAGTSPAPTFFVITVNAIEIRYKVEDGRSLCSLEVNESLMNINGILHEGVVYSMADTGMGAALHSLLPEDEMCATIEIKIVYLKAVTYGAIECETRVIQKGDRVAVIESDVMNGDRLVAKALGTFSILKRIRESSSE